MHSAMMEPNDRDRHVATEFHTEDGAIPDRTEICVQSTFAQSTVMNPPIDIAPVLNCTRKLSDCNVKCSRRIGGTSDGADIPCVLPKRLTAVPERTKFLVVMISKTLRCKDHGPQ